MAKTKHNHLLDTIDEIITDGKKKGILHLYTEDEEFSGRRVQIKGKSMCHFGTTGYLGLEQDIRLKEAAVEAIMRYGTQFPLSKTYLSHGLYKQLEEHLEEMYKNPLLITKNSTLGHIGVIPGIVRDEDAVILDHQVHASVQNACQLLKPRGISVDIIRHSNLNMLEDRLKEYGNKYRKVWYMIDGVYSMFGDCAPFQELLYLMEKYPHFHIYADDVHGMSWAGKNGTGYVMSQVKELPHKMVLTGTLSKSFGASGSIVVFSDEELCRKVKTFGGPQTFSAQLEPASVAAALASCKIHLSPEIYEMQKELADKIEYCNSLLSQTDIPLVEKNNCPVFFIATGLPATGYNFVERIMNEGYYVNLGVFPAVPVKNTGVRFTISRHNQKEDIKGLVEAIQYHYPKALADENKTQNQVRKAFDLPLLVENNHHIAPPDLTISTYNSIVGVDKTEWNNALGNNGNFDWSGLKFLEEVFSNNTLPEENWKFYYYIIRETTTKKVVLATFFTEALWKDDMLAPASVSMQVEEKRKLNPYYLTSQVYSMGCLATEGNHLFLDKSNKLWSASVLLLLDSIEKTLDKSKSSMLVLRDLFENDEELRELLINQGFLKINMPEACVVEELKWSNEEEYLNNLSSKSRSHVRTNIYKFSNYFNVEFKDKVSEEEIKHIYDLYLKVKNRNFDLNFFAYPIKFIEKMNSDPNWEFMFLTLKDEFNNKGEKLPVAVGLNYKSSSNNYCPVMLGMDYDYQEKYQLYRQALYQMLQHARNIGSSKVYMGISATIEKRKLGASIIPKVAYVQTKDNFNLELIEGISVQKQAS